MSVRAPGPAYAERSVVSKLIPFGKAGCNAEEEEFAEASLLLNQATLSLSRRSRVLANACPRSKLGGRGVKAN